jgi:uncharacterized protein DUF6891
MGRPYRSLAEEAADLEAVVAERFPALSPEGEMIMTTMDMRRIASAFAELEDQGVIARANFLCCTGCACEAMTDEQQKWAGKVPPIGAVYFHEQATEGANEGGVLWLGHGSFSGTEEDDRRVAQMTVETLTRHGMKIDWDGDITRKIAAQSPDGRWVLNYPSNAYIGEC